MRAGPAAAAVRSAVAAGAVWLALAGQSGGQAVGKAGSPAAAVRLGLAGAQNSGVSLAADGETVAAVWVARAAGSTDIYASFSSDGGASFGAQARVNGVAGDARASGEQPPRVALGRGVQVVWSSKRDGLSRVRWASAEGAGRPFGAARSVHADGLLGARGWQSLALRGDGSVHVAWLDGRDARAEDAGGHAGHPALRQDVYQAAWRADGTHDEARVARDVCFCCKTAVAVAPDGSVYVAWRHIYPDSQRDIAVARSSDRGRSFSSPVRVSEDRWRIEACPDDGPSLAVDGQGVVHIAWPTLVDGSPAGKAVFYSYSSDAGRSFAPRLRIDDGTGAPGHPQLALGGGRVVIVWDQAGKQRRTFLREVRSTTAAWSPRLSAIAAFAAEGSASYPAVAATPTALVVAFTQAAEAGSEIRVQRLAWGSAPAVP